MKENTVGIGISITKSYTTDEYKLSILEFDETASTIATHKSTITEKDYKKFINLANKYITEEEETESND